MTKLEQYIKSYFGIVENEDMDTIVSFFKQTSIKKGGFLLKSGRICDGLSFVQSGFLRIFFSSGEREITQWISTKGYFCADLASFIFDRPSRYFIQALSDSQIYTISKADYGRLGRLVPKWYELEKLFIVNCFTFLEERLGTHLSMTAEERYDHFFKHNSELFNEVPLQFIASMLGMSPETFSRIRKRQTP